MPPNQYILASDNSPALIPLLRSNPALASAQDDHGYSLLHAASSYGHADLLRTLVREFNVNVNLIDEDGETCLFVAETVEIARCLVEELGVDKNVKNDEGLTAQETISNDGSFPEVAAYLTGDASMNNDPTADILRPSSTLPPNVSVNYNAVSDAMNGENGEPDPEFKRRIEELAAREDFHTPDGQQQLRQLVQDAIRGVDAETEEKDARRRVE